MKPFNSRVELTGVNAGFIALGGLLLLCVGAGAFFLLWDVRLPWLAIAIPSLLGIAGLLLLVYAWRCHVRQITWVLTADAERIAWHRTDVSRTHSHRRQVRIADLTGVTRSYGDEYVVGGVYLDLRSGERYEIGGYLESVDAFLAWAAAHHPHLKISGHTTEATRTRSKR